MVLDALGLPQTERALLHQLDTGLAGTENRSFVLLAEQLKLNYIVKRNAKWMDLVDAFAAGYYLIVCYFDEQEQVGHYAVVHQMSETAVYLHDPFYGPDHEIARERFLTIWHNGCEDETRWFIGLQSSFK